MGGRVDVYSHWGGLGLGARLPMRLTLISYNRFSMAVSADPGLELHFFDWDRIPDPNKDWFCAGYDPTDPNSCTYYQDRNVLLSFVVEPALPIGIKVTDYLTILTGISSPISINFAQRAWAGFGIHLHADAEFALLDNLVLFAKGQFGPHIYDYYPVQGYGMAGVQWKIGKLK